MQHHPQQQQLVKMEWSSFVDSAMMEQVLATHSPDGRDMDLEPNTILYDIEETLRNAIPASFDGVNDGTHDGHVKALAGEEKAAFTGFDDVDDSLAHVIHKISCEFSCKCSGGDDNASTMAILNMLSGYTWEAKMLISLGAFSVNVGEFWLVARLIATDPLAKSVALLKRLPNIIEHYKSVEPLVKQFNDLIKAMLEVTKCIIELKKLPYPYLQYDGLPTSTEQELTHVPTAAYSCIKSMVACATKLTSLLGKNYEYIAALKAWIIPLDLAHKVYNFHKHLKEILDNYYENLIIKPTISEPKSITEIIFALFGTNPLFYGSSTTTVNVNELSKKNVLLLISDLDISVEKVRFLNNVYLNKQPNHQYEVVWVPVVDGPETQNESHQKNLKLLRSKMNWLVPQHPIESAVIRCLKQVSHFEKKPILVVLDPQGNVTSSNALNMVWIWENKAYPFTDIIERDLWKKESWTQSWTLELLVDRNDLSKWTAEKKNICLYGGDNFWWIREFTKLAATVAQDADIELQMVYVGKSGAKERISKISAKIEKRIRETISDEEKLRYYTWTDPTKVWNIWTRLESMLYSKLQHVESYENDRIMNEVMTMMSFDGSNQGWAFICNGVSEMARANADLALQSLEEYHNWEVNKQQIGFVPALSEYLAKLHTSEHCNRIILPWISGGLPEVPCSECGKKMEKFFMLHCCTD